MNCPFKATLENNGLAYCNEGTSCALWVEEFRCCSFKLLALSACGKNIYDTTIRKGEQNG